jgi:hypothetical protein
MGTSSIPSTGGTEIRSFKGFSLMGSHSLASISFAKGNIPYVYTDEEKTRENKLIFDFC